MKGGKRAGSGRTRADTVIIMLKLDTRTALRLRAMVPVGKRSEYVSQAIEHCLSFKPI